MRLPLSFLNDSIGRACFLDAVERKPRMLCTCHWVSFISSARLAPLVRASNASTFALLLPVRTLMGAFFLALARSASFRAVAVPFFAVACFLEEAFPGATGAPCLVPEAGVAVSRLVIVSRGSFSALAAHDDSSLKLP